MAESSIIPPRVPFLDPRSGLMSREWYLFFLGIARLVTPDGSDTSIQDLALAPTLESGIARYDEAIVALQGVQVSPAVPDAQEFEFDATTYCSPANQTPTLGSGGVTGILPLANGGTGANLTASVGGMVYSTASAMAILSGTATAGQIVRSGASAAPTWSTATYPATAGTAANVLRSDGTNFLSAALAAADLSNGTTGSGAVVLASSPTITTPTIAAINLPTPSTWNLGEPIEMGLIGSAMWSVSATDFRMTNNLYYNSGFKFAGTGYATYYTQNAGTHIFANSTASGSAGNAATMQDLLTIATTGAVTLNKTPPAFAAGDKYLVIDASGNIHVSALGPAS